MITGLMQQIIKTGIAKEEIFSALYRIVALKEEFYKDLIKPIAIAAFKEKK